MSPSLSRPPGAPPGRSWAARSTLLVVLSVALCWLDLRIAGRDLSPAASALLAGALHLPPAAVRVGRAALHPLGEVRLRDVEIALPEATLRAGQVVVRVDPLQALGGRVRPGPIEALDIEARPVAGALLARARRARLVPQGGGLGRLQVHDVRIEDAAVLPLLGPLAIDHLSADLDLRGARMRRLAASGVRLAGLGPADLLITQGGQGGPEGAGGPRAFRVALTGGLFVGRVRGEAIDSEMTLERLPLQLSPLIDLENTHASGHLDLRLLPPAGAGEAALWRAVSRREGTLRAAGKMVLMDLSMHHPLLSSVVLPHLTVALEGEVSAERGKGGGLRVATPGLSIQSGDARLHVEGDAEVTSGENDTGYYRSDVSLRLDPIECSRLLQALPRAMVPKLEGLGVTGQLGGVLRLAFDSRALPDLDLQTDLQIGCKVVTDPPQADVHAVLDERLAVARQGPRLGEDGANVGEEVQQRRLPLGPLAPGADGDPGFQPLSELPWPVVRAFLVAEDNQFYVHHGFDTQMIARALGTDLLERQTTRGASTVSQQLVKNLWLSQERALGRKLEEAVLAWRLEQVVGKDRILEVYLNLVELGSGIYGVSAAAQHYFRQNAGGLTLDQAEQLASLLPAPRRGMDDAWGRRYRDLLRRYPTAHVPRPEAARR